MPEMTSGRPFESSLMELPWLRVVDKSGTPRACNLQEFFLTAPEINRLDGELPTQDAAVLRFLVALVLVAVADEEMDESAALERWTEWWEDWSALADIVLVYIEKHRDEFDLLHPEQPFLQHAELEPAGKLEPGLGRLIPDVSQWFSTRDAARPMTLDEAPRWMLQAQGFSVAGIHTGQKGDDTVTGGRGYPNGFPAWLGNLGLVLWHGENLAQTILLNLPLGMCKNAKRAGWQMDRPLNSVREGFSPTLAELLVWPSRRLKLHVDPGGMIRTVQVSYGDMITPYNLNWCEPMSAWRRSEAQSKKAKHDVMMPVRHDPSKQVWRGLGSVLSRGDGRQRPATATWLDELVTSGALDASMPVRMQIVGMEYGPQNSSVDTIVDDSLVAPLVSLTADSLVRTEDAAVSLAAKGVGALTLLATHLAVATGMPEEPARARAAQAGYAAIDPWFRAWMLTLTDPDATGDYVVSWHRALRRALLQRGQEQIAAAGPAAVRGRKVDGRLVNSATAWASFHAKVCALTPEANHSKESQE